MIIIVSFHYLWNVSYNNYLSNAKLLETPGNHSVSKAMSWTEQTESPVYYIENIKIDNSRNIVSSEFLRTHWCPLLEYFIFFQNSEIELMDLAILLFCLIHVEKFIITMEEWFNNTNKFITRLFLIQNTHQKDGKK